MSDRQIISAFVAASVVFLWFSNYQAIRRDPQGIFFTLSAFALAVGFALEATGLIKTAYAGIGLGVVLALICLFLGFCDFLTPGK